MAAGRMVVAVVVALGAVFVAGAAVAWAVGGRPLPATDTGPPAAGVGTDIVQLSPDARVHPAAREVWSQLQVHFDAINNRDYAAWRTTVVPARAEALPEARWRDVYATTRDGSVHVNRIDDLPGGGLLVRLRFVSTQDLEDAPPAVPATRICWRNSLPMTGSPPRIERADGASSAPQACP